jgi:hypothetical protein
MTGEPAWLWWALGAAGLLAVPAIWIWIKGRPFAQGDVFRASRLSRGNRLFPTQVQITPTTVVQFTPEWFGRQELSIHLAHVASVKIDTNLIFSNVLIETSGGAQPIVCHGHRKRDAMRMKALIERYQTSYYRERSGGGQQPAGTEVPGR